MNTSSYRVARIFLDSLHLLHQFDSKKILDDDHNEAMFNRSTAAEVAIKYQTYDQLHSAAKKSTLTTYAISKQNALVGKIIAANSIATINKLTEFNKIRSGLINKLENIIEIEQNYQKERVKKKFLPINHQDNMSAVDYFANKFDAVKDVWDEKGGYESLKKQIQIIEIYRKRGKNMSPAIESANEILLMKLLENESQEFRKNFSKFQNNSENTNLTKLKQIIQAIESEDIIVSSGRCNSQTLHNDSKIIVDKANDVLKLLKGGCTLTQAAAKLLDLESYLIATESSERPLEEIATELSENAEKMEKSSSIRNFTETEPTSINIKAKKYFPDENPSISRRPNTGQNFEPDLNTVLKESLPNDIELKTIKNHQGRIINHQELKIIKEIYQQIEQNSAISSSSSLELY